MKEKKLIKAERFLSFAFEIMFLLYTFFQSMVVFHRTPFVSIALWGALAFGAAACCLRVVFFRRFVHTGGIVLLGLFLVSYAIAILVNIQYGAKSDAINWLILVLTISVIYLQDVSQDKKSIRRQISLISLIYTILLNLSVAVSLIMLAIPYGEVIYFEDYQLNIGFVENRLWGVFIDPNLASVFSVVAIVLAISNIIQKKYRAFSIFTILLLLFYIGVADSRTGMLGLFFGIAFFTFMIFQKRLSVLRKKLVRYSVCVLLALILGYVSASIPGTLQEGYNALAVIEENGDDDSRVIKRDYDMSEDVSNKRFDIWKSGLEIFSTKPLTGIAFHHLKDYADIVLPETYLAQEGVNFSHLHNELLNVLVSQGIPGMIIILLFAGTSIAFVFKGYADLAENDFYEYTGMITCLLSISVGMMLQQGILYSYMPVNILFWMFLGYMRTDSESKECIGESSC